MSNHPKPFGQANTISQATLETRLKNARNKAEELLQENQRPNSERACRSDLRYFWAWASAAFALEEHYPVAQELIYAFVSEHLSGLDAHVDAVLRQDNQKMTAAGTAHKLSTVRRRLSSLAKKHRSELPELDSRYVYHPAVRDLLKAAGKQSRNKPQQKDAMTLDVLNTLIERIDISTLRGVLLRAILAVGFASGGRRRSELVGMEFNSVQKITDASETGFYFLIRLTESKTQAAGSLLPEVPVTDEAAVYLQAWLDQAQIREGRLFRSISRYNTLGASLSAEWIRREIKQLHAKAIAIRPEMAALDLSPHSIRAGFVTQCGLANIPAPEAMALSLHKSEAVFNRYYRPGKVVHNQAARLMKRTGV